MISSIRTRFAPSPTGFLHIGSLRTAAYAYALAKHSGGQFLLRIEDTDQKRNLPNATEKLQGILRKFHLNWDEEPLVQSQRLEIYQKAARQLVSLGHAYEEEGAIRLKVPQNETITFHDFILNKDISWESSQIPPAVLLKSDGFPTYHLASIVDDHASQITHVIRSSEWIPSTPIHILVYRYLDYDPPQIGHPTAILDPTGGKLSKRKGNVSVEEFINQGYLPEAILNFVILLGWAPKDNRELFTLDEFVTAFDAKGFQKSNPLFNQKKLDWFNGHYIRQKSDLQLQTLIKPYLPQITPQIIPLIKDRLVTLSQSQDLAGFFFTRPQPQSVDSNHIQSAIQALQSADWSKSAIDESLLAMCDKHNFPHGDFFMDLRLAICGQKITPPLTESMLILGKQEVLLRLNQN